ncbi:MAG TPA: polyprenol phosphomannose-dependent alpha 1,6 mannosyltransferase MptB [Actinomycetota bacterium]|nr:polyprenol phosphomannose-dependent alpha 1,6 mannosyltransferase MptB [Actinomycetota bacterium]
MAPFRTSWPVRGALFAMLAGYFGFVLIASAPSSPLRPPLPRRVGVPAWGEMASEWIGLDRLTHDGLTVMALLLLAALLAAFTFISREAWNERTGLGSVIAITAVSLGLVTAGPLVLSRDVYSYASYGRMYAVSHTNPYVASPSKFGRDPFTGVVSNEWRNTPSVYGPAFTLLSAAIAGAARNSPAATVWTFKVLAVIAAGGAAYLAAAASRAVRPGKEAFAVAVVGLNPLMVLHVVGAGHNDALVAALLAGALLVAVCAARSRDHSKEANREASGSETFSTASAIAVTVLITLAALIKVIAAIPLLLWLAYLVRSSPPRRRVRVAGIQGAVAIAVTAAVTAPLFSGGDTLRAIGNVAGREGWASSARLVARTLRALTGVELGSSADVALSVGVYLGFLAVFLTLTWQLFRATGGDPAAVWGGGLLLFALAASYLLPWYAAWFLPFVPFLMNVRLGTVALVVAGLLTLTGVPAEPGLDPSLWRNMILVVHYVVAPAMLALLFVAAVRVRRLGMLQA